MKKLLLIIAALFLLNGCATYVKPVPMNFINKKSALSNGAILLISDADLKKTNSVVFGLFGMFTPVVVKTGDTLAGYSKEYFNRFFKEVLINQNNDNYFKIHLSIEKFTVYALNGQASLDLKIIIKDRKDNIVLEKKYSGTGDTHAPLYFGYSEFDAKQKQVDQIYKSTDQAFNSVFTDIQFDLAKMTFYR